LHLLSHSSNLYDLGCSLPRLLPGFFKTGGAHADNFDIAVAAKLRARLDASHRDPFAELEAHVLDAIYILSAVPLDDDSGAESTAK